MPVSTTKILRRDRQRKAAKHAAKHKERDERRILRLERDERRILRLRAVEVRTGLKHSSIYQAIAEGTFPQPVPITDRAVGWVSDEIDAWIEGRIAEREQAA
jgi:prophage regulatory protein